MKGHWTKKHEHYLTKVIEPIENRLKEIMVGQRHIIRRVVQGLFAVGQRDFTPEGKRFLGVGHVLNEGGTGTGKTVLCKAIACLLSAKNNRVQGVPDGMPADITGNEIILLTGDTKTIKGPIFCNILLADEINRWPPKVQAGFNQALAEGEVTVGGVTYKLDNPFFCLATQNPTEQKGTSKIQEALADRFIMCLIFHETSQEEKVLIEERTRHFRQELFSKIVDIKEINEAREFLFDNTYVSHEAGRCVGKLITAVNHAEEYGLFKRELDALAGGRLFKQNPPLNDRSVLHLAGMAMIEANWNCRSYVLPKDVCNVAADVLRVRLMLVDSSVYHLLEQNKDQYQTETELREHLLQEIIDKVVLP